jgi:hypothetical protein
MWAESAVSALTSIGRKDILGEFNVPRLYADCTMWHPKYLQMIARGFGPALRATNQGMVMGAFQFAGRFSYLTRLRAHSLISRLAPGAPPQAPVYSVKGLGDIAEAVEALTKHLQSSGRHFDEGAT